MWARNLSGGAVAVGLYNKNYTDLTPAQLTRCVAGLNHTPDEVPFPAGGDAAWDRFHGVTVEDAARACCASSICAGFMVYPNKSPAAGPAHRGAYLPNTGGGLHRAPGAQGYTKPGFQPGHPTLAPITVDLRGLGLEGPVAVRDIWERHDLGTFTGTYTAHVPPRGTAFLRLTPAAAEA